MALALYGCAGMCNKYYYYYYTNAAVIFVLLMGSEFSYIGKLGVWFRDVQLTFFLQESTVLPSMTILGIITLFNEAGENCKVWCFIICTHHQILTYAMTKAFQILSNSSFTSSYCMTQLKSIIM
jgi:hypothetical protein